MTDVRSPWLLLWPLFWLVGAGVVAFVILLALAWYPLVALAVAVCLVSLGVRRAVASSRVRASTGSS